jgi:aminoglycoside/choline kinase family phosphotransferase
LTSRGFDFRFLEGDCEGTLRPETERPATGFGAESGVDYNRFLMDVLRQQFERHFGCAALHVEPVQGGLGGSGRTIVRLSNDRCSAIGVANDVRAENAAFLGFSRHFRRHGLPVPEIYAEDLDAGAYLQEDLGDCTLFDFLRQQRAREGLGNASLPAAGAGSGNASLPAAGAGSGNASLPAAGAEAAAGAWEMYRRVVEILPRFQVEAGRDLNYKVCYPRGSFDRQSIAWDLNYFKYYFLRLAGVPFHEEALEKDFRRLTSFLLSADRGYFLYRDFQSRNIMVRQGQPYFIDYQGGRRGALQYDIASLLFDAKADLAPELRQQLLDRYLDSLAGFIELDREAFLHHYHAYVYIRIMQALGAYGFRGYYERKAHFLESVPYALKNVRWLLNHAKLPVELPALMAAFDAMSASKPGVAAGTEMAARTPAPAAMELTVTVSSFSFHRGPLADESGNGGGFVFDARSLPNPGREERFKRQSGKDAAVMEYLNQQAAVGQFLASAMALVDASVSEYKRRGFGHLMVSFGCTGGQHRSVFLAEQTARRLAGRDGVRVVLRHREQESWIR